MEDLKSGMEDLKSGMEDLKGGTEDLKGGTEDLKGAMEDLKSGTEDLKSGMEDLKIGMEDLKSARRPIRRQFEVLSKELKRLFKEVPFNEDLVLAKFKLFVDNFDALLEQDDKVVEQLAVECFNQDDVEDELADIHEFKMRAEEVRMQIEELFPPMKLESLTGASSSAEGSVRNLEPPTVEMMKFSGELKEWQGFWAQFQTIHEEPLMNGRDKLWYLRHSLEPASYAYQIAYLYPLSNENYMKVVEVLKNQFEDGNEEPLLQERIRELLILLILNAKEKLPTDMFLSKLLHELRALNSLNLEKADLATLLFPVVELSLPEEVHYSWHRTGLSQKDGSKDDPPTSRLDILMSFVQEVLIQQGDDLALDFAKQLSLCPQIPEEPEETENLKDDKPPEEGASNNEENE